MGWVFALILSVHAHAEASGQLELSGFVPPTLSAVVAPAHDGFSLTNLGNEIAFFQVNLREASMQRVAQLAQGQSITLRTEYEERIGLEPVEIRIMAP